MCTKIPGRGIHQIRQTSQSCISQYTRATTANGTVETKSNIYQHVLFVHHHPCTVITFYVYFCVYAMLASDRSRFCFSGIPGVASKKNTNGREHSYKPINETARVTDISTVTFRSFGYTLNRLQYPLSPFSTSYFI